MADTKLLAWDATTGREVEVVTGRLVVGTDPGDLNDNDVLITTPDTAAEVSDRLTWLVRYSMVMHLMEVVGR